MEPGKKTTVLLSSQLHDRLTKLARQKGVSMGQLVREACEQTYGLTSRERRLEAVRGLASLSLPVDDISRMKEQAVPSPVKLLEPA
jgi:predicted DNA-binding ribbon-helix-helix protein